MEVNRYQLFCNTSQGTIGSTPQHAYFSCKPAYIKKHPLNWFSVKLTSVEIPYQWTQVNSTNSLITWRYTSGATITNGSFNLSNGNYNSTTLLAQLFAQLSTSLPAYNWTNNSSYTNSTNKFTFSIIGKDGIATTLLLRFSLNTFIGGMFGCVNDVSFGYTAGNASINALSQNTINVNPVSSIYIRSSLLKQAGTISGNNQESMVSGYSPDISDIVAKLQILTPPFTYVFWTNQVNVETRISNAVIDSFDLYLSDNVSFFLNITQDWTFGLTIIEYSPHNHPQFDMISKLSGNLHDHQLASETPKEQVQEEDRPIQVKKFQRQI
jgi:hypothetical protein